jgi:peptide/nickel transport system substrate-binding protein
MQKFKISLVLMLILVVGLFSTAVLAQDVAREDTVIFDIDGAVGTIATFDNYNWMIPGGQRNQGYHQSVSEPLFILNYETGQIEPWLAESMTSNDTLDVWTLVLRDGAYWSDGEAFNADDVLFTINLLLNDDTLSLNNAGDMQQWVTSVEKVDDTTVVFNLAAPNPRFQLDYFSVRIWGGINMLPEHIWADKDPFTFTFYDPEQGWPIGTGAYKLTSASETEFVYDRDDNWWGAATGTYNLPEPLRLIWVVTGDDSIRATLASDNQLDSVMDVTFGAFEAIQAANPNMVAWYDAAPFVWLDPCPRQLSLNNTVAPWDNVEMRRMLNFATDRNEVIEIAYEGLTVPSRSMFVEYGGLFPYIDAMEAAGITLSPSADLAAAEAILTEQGYARNADGFWEKDGEVLSLVMQAHEGFIEKRRVADDLVEQYQRFGIDASSQPVAGPTWEDNKHFGNYEGTLDWDACGSINEPWASMNNFTAQWVRPIGETTVGNNNHVRWSGAGNDRYSEIVAQIGVLPLGDPQIVDLVVEAMTIWYDEMPFLPLNQARKLVPFDTTYWTGWPSAENNFNHPATWWQSTHQIIQNLHKAGA